MLSADIWLHILDFLDCKSLLICMETSRAMRDLICGTASLRYKVALEKANLKDGPTNEPGDITSSSATRLEKLADHQKAWKTLSWTQDMRIKSTRAGLWELFGGVFAQNTPNGGFTFHQLPSQLRSIPYETWTLDDDFDFTVRDFGMDPAQHLLVLIECPAPDHQYKLHLMNIKDGKPYTGVPKSDLCCPARLTQRPSSFAIQVAGDYIGVLSLRTDGPQDLTIWNWKTGAVKLSTYSVELKSFAFLSPELVLVANVGSAGVDNGALDLVNFQNLGDFDEPCSYADVHPLARLQYPSYNDPTYLHDLEIRNDPGPMWREKGAVPFSLNPTESLFVVRMWLIVHRSVGCLLHLIPSKVLLSLAESRGTISWSEWGPKDTMITLPQGPQPSTWVCFVHGWKCVTGQQIVPDQIGFTGYYCNFSPTALFSETQGELTEESVEDESEEDPGPWRSPDDVPFHDLFQQPIGQHVPHKWRKFHLPDSHAHCELMCTEDAIIIVDVRTSASRIEYVTDDPKEYMWGVPGPIVLKVCQVLKMMTA